MKDNKPFASPFTPAKQGALATTEVACDDSSQMTPAETNALAAIRLAAVNGRIRETGHAAKRMRERGVTFAGLRRALTSSTGCLVDAPGKWRVNGGVDQDGDSLTVVCVLEGDGTIVVTLF